MDLQGKVAVVCGASRGLGLAVAKRLSEEGCKVAICARSADDLEEARGMLIGPAYAEQCDLRNERDTALFIANVERMLGPVDLLVANAATITVAPIDALEPHDFREAMDTTFYTSLHAAMAILPFMEKRGKGTIAFVTSIGGKVGVPHLAPYCAAKFAAVGFAETLRAEVAEKGIDVVTIVPGLMRTGSHLHVQVKGDVENEYAWFGASATTPVIAMHADRAAERIVTGIRTHKKQIVFTPEARFAARTKDLMPNVWAKAMSVVASFLPKGTSKASMEGEEIEELSDKPAVRFVRERGEAPALRHNQV